MKALVLEQYKVLKLIDMPVPECGPGDLLVRVKACGICGSDVHGYDGSTGRRLPPIVMGHEGASIVEAVGDRAEYDYAVSCGHCFFCSRSQTNLCDNRQVLGVRTPEFKRHGAFARLVKPAQISYELPDTLGFKQAALIGAVSIAVDGVNRTPVRLRDTRATVDASMTCSLGFIVRAGSNAPRWVAGACRGLLAPEPVVRLAFIGGGFTSFGGLGGGFKYDGLDGTEYVGRRVAPPQGSEISKAGSGHERPADSMNLGAFADAIATLMRASGAEKEKHGTFWAAAVGIVSSVGMLCVLYLSKDFYVKLASLAIAALLLMVLLILLFGAPLGALRRRPLCRGASIRWRHPCSLSAATAAA